MKRLASIKKVGAFLLNFLDSISMILSKGKYMYQSSQIELEGNYDNW